MRPSAVEQVFLERKHGGTEVLLVLEDPAGGRTREKLPLPIRDLEQAVLQVGRRLAQRGVGAAGKVRLRVGSEGRLRDDPQLLRLFLAELAAGQEGE